MLCVPDHRDVARLDAALTAVLGPGHHVVLTAGAGPARRYREFLAVSRGTRRIVVGTRAAAFAPVHDLGLVAIWDDGDDLHAEPRAPYPHAREVLLTRATVEGAAALVGGFARSVEAEQLLATGWAHELAAPREALRAAVTVSVPGATDRELERDPLARATRMPKQVYARGRRPAWSTGRCWSTRHAAATPRRWPASAAVRRPGAPSAPARSACPARRSRPPAAGAAPSSTPGPARSAATAASAPRWSGSGVPPRSWAAPSPPPRSWPRAATTSSRRCRPRPAIVVATPGAEPVAEGGYAAVVVLDTWLALARPDLRTEEEALRRWCGAAGLVAPGGSVVVVGDPALPVVQALVRWDPAGFAQRESAARAEAHLPPASRLATITGEPGAVDDALTLLDRPPGTEVLGPVEVDDGPRGSSSGCRVPTGQSLSRALGEVQRVRSARKLDPVRIQVDPVTL